MINNLLFYGKQIKNKMTKKILDIREKYFTYKYRILLLGLDNSGKTTLLYLLSDNKISEHPPTNYPNFGKFYSKMSCLEIHDMPGDLSRRRLWSDYYMNINGIIFVIDCRDFERFNESKMYLNDIIKNNKNKPILVIGNKIDIPSSFSEEYLKKTLEIENNPQLSLFMCSIKNKYNVNMAIDDLIKNLNN